jgi:hypothetical protein
MPIGQPFPTKKNPPKQTNQRPLKPTKASGVGGTGNQLQKMAKNRLRRG